jgi:PAS domain S-box-containing protein
MNIKNQIRLSVFISLVLVAAISVSIVLSYQDMQDLRQQESLAADVVRGSYELTYLSNDYLINAEPRARAQWEERYSSVQPVIGQLKPGNSREAKSLEAIRDYNDKIGALFREIPEPGTLRAGETLFPASYQQITWSRMNIQSQGMIYEAWSLRRLYNDDVSEARYRNNILVLVLMMVMLVIIGVNYLVISRRLVRSIREVNAGSEVFATGNLDYRIPVTSDDEIGGIARRLNTMAEQIRNVTASRDELDREKQGHGQAEQALTESERKYRNLYQYAQVGLFETSFKDGTVVACNRQYAELAGFPSVEAAIGQDILHLYVNPEDRTEVGRILREQGYIENHIVKFRNQATGKEFWGQFSARFNYAQEVAEGTIIDVTAQKEAEAEIRNAKKFLDSVIEQSPNPIWISDEKGTLLRLNRACCDVLRITPEEVVGKYNIFEDSIVETQGKMPLVRSVFEEGKSVNFDLEYDSKLLSSLALGHYTRVYLNVTIFPVRDSSGKITHAVIQHLDFTERRLAEEALRESTVRLSLALGVGNAGVWEWNIKTNEVRFDEGFHRLLGYSPGELPATLQEWMPYHNQDDLPVWMGKAGAYLRGDAPMYESEHRIRTKTGDWAWVFTRGQFVNSPTLGPRTLFVGIAMNVTGRRQVEEALHLAHERLQSFVDANVVGFAIANPGGEIIETNDYYLNLIDYTREEFRQGRVDWRSITPPEWLPADEHAIEELRKRGKCTPYEKEYIRRDGTRVSVFLTDMMLSGPEELIMAFVIDITDLRRAEAELTTAQQQYRELFDSVNIGILRSTPGPEGSIIEANPTALRIFEAESREQLLAVRPSDLYFDHEQRRKISEEIVTRGAITDMEVRYKSLKGRSFWGRITAIKRTADDGTVYFDNTIDDITGRKRAEDALRETAEYLNKLIDFANAPIIVWDPAFRITRFNQAFESLSGRTAGEVAGQRLDILFPEEDRDGLFTLIRETTKTRRLENIRIPILASNGTVRTVLWNSASILTADAELVSTIAQGTDITEIEQAVAALRESEEKYRVLFTRMTEGSALHEMVYDKTGNPADYRILDANPAFERVLGIRGADVTGKTSREAYGVATPPFLDTYARVAATGEPEMFETYFEPLKKHFSISAFSPEKGKFATIFEDITDRKQAEEFRERLIKELEQKNAELERFTYTVSHDLKSPLITIKGFAGLLEDDAGKRDPVQLKKDVRRIIAAADTMQELLADVLELSRVGRVISLPENTPFGTIAKGAVDLLAGPLADRGVRVEIAPDLPVISVDRARIREVMANLIENGVKFMGSQQNPVIRIGVDLDGTTPVFFVQDNGIGIDPRYLERIFNLFERLDVSTLGTGIGLTIVRRIIEVHGGEIWAESEGPGKGTTFRFTLPGPAEKGD